MKDYFSVIENLTEDEIKFQYENIIEFNNYDKISGSTITEYCDCPERSKSGSMSYYDRTDCTEVIIGSIHPNPCSSSVCRSRCGGNYAYYGCPYIIVSDCRRL